MRVGAAAAALALAFAAATAGMAQAETFNLTIDGCGTGSSACLTPTVTSMGTVQVEDVSGSLQFTVTLQNALFNANGNGQHNALVFDINSPSALTFTGAGLTTAPTTGVFTVQTSPNYDNSPFGHNVWPYAIDYTGGLGQGSTPSTLTFTVSDTAHDLTLTDLASAFTYGGQPIYIAADVYSLATGQTGNVGAGAGVPDGAVPEPATWAMMILGVGLIGFAARRRRAALAFAA